MKELYKVYRPKKLSHLLGQEAVVSQLKTFVENQSVPHALLLSGPSGTGKTTVARILRKCLGCGLHDYNELNCADFRGVDTVRDIRRISSMAPLTGGCRMWVIDEAHKLTNDAQNALLKLLEDTPSHVYLVLATTEPERLLKTIHTRCTELVFKPMSVSALEQLLDRVCKAEGIKLEDEVRDELISIAEGSARKALVFLQQVATVKGVDARLAALVRSQDNQAEAIQLARLLFKQGVAWTEVAKVLKSLTEEPESVRRLILGYARSVILGGGKAAHRAFVIIDIFSRNFYDSQHAGLAAACWEAVCGT
jgi:DNA polymerase-3 subunit gamma/tau